MKNTFLLKLTFIISLLSLVMSCYIVYELIYIDRSEELKYSMEWPRVEKCIVDLTTGKYYHESYMCDSFMEYEFTSERNIIEMSKYEADERGFKECPDCSPAFVN